MVLLAQPCLPSLLSAMGLMCVTQATLISSQCARLAYLPVRPGMQQYASVLGIGQSTVEHPGA